MPRVRYGGAPLVASDARFQKRKPFPFLLLSFLVLSIWLAKTSLSPPFPKPGEPALFYSMQARQNLHHILLSAIENASRSIYLVMFGLTDPAILQTLKEKAEDQIPTEIYYDRKGSPPLEKTLGGEVVLHTIKSKGLMHQKILVLDDAMVFLGSANFTPSSLKMHDNLVVGLFSPQIARFLKSHAPDKPGHLLTHVGGQELSLWLLPDPKGHVLLELRKKIRAAKKSLFVSLFTFTHKSLAEEIARAHARGVRVKVVLDLYSGIGASAQVVEFLKKEGVPVFLSQGPQLLHHKFALIDDQTLVMGSANWTKAAFTKNNDCLLCLSPLTKEQKDILHAICRRVFIGSNRS